MIRPWPVLPLALALACSAGGDAPTDEEIIGRELSPEEVEAIDEIRDELDELAEEARDLDEEIERQRRENEKLKRELEKTD